MLSGNLAFLRELAVGNRYVLCCERLVAVAGRDIAGLGALLGLTRGACVTVNGICGGTPGSVGRAIGGMASGGSAGAEGIAAAGCIVRDATI